MKKVKNICALLFLTLFFSRPCCADSPALLTFYKVSPAIAKHSVVTGSLAVYLHTLRTPFVSEKERSKLKNMIKDIDLVVDDPRTVGLFNMSEAFSDNNIKFTKRSGSLIVGSVKVDLISHLGKRFFISFSSFFESTHKCILANGVSIRIEGMKALIARYKNPAFKRTPEQEANDLFKVNLLEKMLENRSVQLATPNPKTRRKKIDLSLGGLRPVRKSKSQ